MDGVYDTLFSAEHIRILTLGPSEDVEGALQCSISQQHIEDPSMEYEAISYTWGDQERSQSLRCGDKMMKITPNLASALLCLRSRITPRRLWADAICINQDDLDEKAQQIPLMARIFRSATQVRVWLGDGDEGESQALDDIASFARRAGPRRSSLDLAEHQNLESETHKPETYKAKRARRRRLFPDLVTYQLDESETQQSETHQPETHEPETNQAENSGPRRPSLGLVKFQDPEPETSQAIVDMGRSAKKVFRMPWFGRRWIVQELVLNGNVMFHCGQANVSWPALHFTFHALPTGTWDNDLDVHIRRKLRQFGDLWNTWSFGNASTIDCGIYSLLNSFMDLQCKEAKDRVYAIAGLADDIELQSSTSSASVPSITPNYGISDKEVLQDLALKMIRSGKVFSTLAHAGASRMAGAEEPLASWIPDVRHTRSWPLIATERKADFKLVEGCETSNGSLALTIKVYGWEREIFNIFDYVPHGQFDWSSDSDGIMRDWSQLFVKDVFEGPKTQMAHDSHNLPKHIRKWLMDHYKPDPCLYYPLEFGFGTLAHMLWSLIRCQLLTEDGCEAFNRLPSVERLEKQLSDERLDSRWETYLTKALSTRKIYIGQHLFDELDVTIPKLTRFFGFGPYDLRSHDAILLPTSDSKSATALFLRPEGSEYRVLGGGLAWAWPEDVPVKNFVSREVEFHLI